MGNPNLDNHVPSPERHGGRTDSSNASERFSVHVSDVLSNRHVQRPTSAEEALSVILSNRAKGAVDDTPAAMAYFIAILRERFAQSVGMSEAFDSWEKLIDEEEFEAAVLRYLENEIPDVLSGNESASPYEEIEFCLHLLWTARDFDVANDVSKNSEWMSLLFDRMIRKIPDLSVPGPVPDAETCRKAERRTALVERLSELLETLIRMRSVNAMYRESAYALSKMVGAHLMEAAERIAGMPGNESVVDRLQSLTDTVSDNFAHLEYFAGDSPENVEYEAERICSRLESEEKCAYVRLLSIRKIAEEFWPVSPRLLERRKQSMDALVRAYSENAPTGSETGASDVRDASEGIGDFIRRRSHSVVQLETVHHFVLFWDVAPDLLFGLIEHLVWSKPYGNVYYEELKIKILSVALSKIPPSSAGDARTVPSFESVRRYAARNERRPWLMASFAPIYLELALRYAEILNDVRTDVALECFLRFDRMAGGNSKFDAKRSEFLKRIGGAGIVERFDETRRMEDERQAYNDLVSMYSQAAVEQLDVLGEKIYAVIERLFQGFCEAEIREESHEGAKKDEWNRRGYALESIPLWDRHFLLLHYPTSLETPFSRLFATHSDFLGTSLSGILRIGITNRELSEAKRRAESESRTDRVTGLPNALQFEEDWNRVRSPEDIWHILIQLDNLPDLTRSYGEETVRRITIDVKERVFKDFFNQGAEWSAETGDGWKVYSMDDWLFLAMGKKSFELSWVTAENLVTALKEIMEMVHFDPGDGSGMRIQTRVSLAYCEGERDDIVKKLRISLEERGQRESGIVCFSHEEFAKSERGFAENFKGSAEVAEAIRDNRITAHYQAIVDNVTGELAKVEALSRMRMLDGTVPPSARFIGYAKQSNLLAPVTRRTFQAACEDFKILGTDFSFNVGGQELSDPDFFSFFKDTISEHSIPPERVTVEILEEGLSANWKDYAERILRFKRLGCKIALDDFWAADSGYSRFLHVGWWPDILKIDGAFVRDIQSDAEKRRVLRAIVRSADELGCETVAEFVDNAEAWKILRELGVKYSQGFFFHKPQGSDVLLPRKFELPK